MVTQQYKNRFDNGCMMMKGTQKIFSPLIFKPVFCLLFICLVSVAAFGQINSLLLAQEDIRLEFDFLDGERGYSLFIRKKQGVESVMLTEPAGFHALRSLKWNGINGNPSSHTGTVFLDINEDIQINIRTFDHKFADPNTGKINSIFKRYYSPIEPNYYFCNCRCCVYHHNE